MKSSGYRPFRFHTTWLSLVWLIILFVASVSLVKYQQLILVLGRNITQLEEEIQDYETKNGELDAKIARLCSTERLNHLIKKHHFVALDNKNVINISPIEYRLFVLQQQEPRNYQQAAILREPRH